MKAALQRSWKSTEGNPSPPFPILSDGPFKSLAQKCLPVKLCRKGYWLITQGDRVDCLYIVREGRMMLTRMSSSGKEVILGFAGPGQFFGEVPLLNGGEAPFNALAIQPTALLVVRRRAFATVLEDPDSARALLEVLADRCHSAWEQVELLGCGSLAERLNAALLMLCREHGVRTSEGIEIPVNQSQLASMVGVTRESLNRQIRELREDTVLRVRKGPHHTSVIVKKPERLFQ